MVFLFTFNSETINGFIFVEFLDYFGRAAIINPMFPTVTFATSCWERDWRQVLLQPDYLTLHQIGNHRFPFSERLLIINNVDDLEAVKRAAAQKEVRMIVAQNVLPFFQLDRSQFNDWQYYNALGPLNAIYHCQTDYLLFLTGDVYLKQPVNWIPHALKWMEKNPQIKVANLAWNENYREAKKESYRTTWNFYVAKEGFSDQMFLVRTADFKAPIYNEIRADGTHYPRGDVWEKRVFSFMKNHGWERITFRRGSYTHENI